MAIDPDSIYGSVVLADAYFENRLHETDWVVALAEDKEKALLAATQDIDALLYAGEKTDEAQPLEFPRDGDTDPPEDILIAAYEIAHERLKGRDPGAEFENLTLTSHGVGSTRVSSDRSQMPPRHLSNGIVSFLAWRYLQPFLADNNNFTVRRIS